MTRLIGAAFSRERLMAMLLTVLLGVGVLSYAAIPKESFPDIPIPTIYVVATLDGVSPQDSERLLVEPLETELAGIAGLTDISARAGEGYGSVTLEFVPGFDSEQAYRNVSEAVDRAQQDMPPGIDDPVIEEINTALFPIMTILLSGDLPERALNQAADEIQDALEAQSGVLEADIIGARDEVVEIVLDPVALESYHITFDEVIGQFSANNQLVAAGAIEGEAGRLVLKVPGLIESADDVLDQPVLVSGSTVVRLADIAGVRNTFEDPTGFARVDGQPALAIEVTKRIGANIIFTANDVRDAIELARETLPEGLSITYFLDESETIRTMLSDLEANVIAAVILVMLVVVLVLGGRSALLVGIAIPGAFLAGVTAIWAMGFTMNNVVLFALILVVGMLVDGAIITTELADRKLSEGADPRAAYQHAATRMAWPIIASTATTLCVFVPLLFWEGLIGEFMKFLPITVMLTLGASVLMALVFIPIVGGLIGKQRPQTARSKKALYAAETGDPRTLSGFTGRYARILHWAILHPAASLLTALAMFLSSFSVYAQYGAGIAFFPAVDPEIIQVDVLSHDALSLRERDALLLEIEARFRGRDEVETLYARVANDPQSAQDIIGTVQLNLIDWQLRRSAFEIAEDLRADVADIAGIRIDVQAQADGPVQGKPIQIEVISRDPVAQDEAVAIVVREMEYIGGFADVTDNRPFPGVEWEIDVDRTRAAEFGANVALVGQAVQLLTQGITVADYRPASTDTPVDIRVRFPATSRTFEDLQSLQVQTAQGLIPIANFTTIRPAPRSGTINRLNRFRVMTIAANVQQDRLVDEQTARLVAALERRDFPEGTSWQIAGEAEEQQEAMTFLLGAFAAAIFGMFAILLLQFNSFKQALVVMSAIVFSIAGVLLGLVITGRPFGVVMVGIGIIALAGIVVNNNIVFIDTYNELRRAGMSVREAALRTGTQRMRPVLLTSVTTALGLMPMVFGMNINFFTRSVTFGAPSTQW